MPSALRLHYLLYDVFTREPLLGNALAVFTDARGLDARRMQAIARELNLSESSFIVPPEDAATDVRMRIFTPRAEMPMAGHPTIGSTFALAHTGVIRAPTPRVTFGLNVGPVPVDLEWGDASELTHGQDADRGPALRFAWMTQGSPSFGPAVSDRSAVADALGLELGALHADLPARQVSCGVPFLLVPLRDRDAVDRAVSDAAALGRLGRALGTDLPVFLFALTGGDDGAGVYSRMFAPMLGVTEDPATGAASGPLGCYLVEHGVVSGDASQRIVNRQGVSMGRASRIVIAIDGRPGVITGVRIGGEAVLVGRGELIL
jgi:trans-2,3-dihydro-3-hydroxyanthranilate isomerase